MKEKHIYICEVCGKEFDNEGACFNCEVSHEKLKTIPEDLMNRFNAVYIKRMKDIVKNTDVERAHGDADDLLCSLLSELGFKELVNMFEEMTKWYS